MKNKKKPIEPPFRTENGRKIYSIEAIVDAVRRPVHLDHRRDAGATGDGGTPAETTGSRVGNSDPAGSQATTTNPDEVRAHFRLLGAVDAWPSMGWLGPQLVRYGHNDAAALRQVPELINNRPKPVPLMWNHSYDIHDKAGKVVEGYWEDSQDIPPGVNGTLVVNRNYDAKAAVGLETGELDSTSICVALEMERSHPDMDFYVFTELAGNPGEPAEVDGQVVCWLPTAATEVLHHALVWAGADADSGPREETEAPAGTPAATKNQGDNTAPGAAAVTNSPEGGGNTRMDELKKLVAAVLAMVGIDAVLGDKGEMSASLHDRVIDKVKGLCNLRELYNEMASKLQALEKDLLREKESSLTSAQILERLPGIVEMAKHGRQYLADLQADALAWFDKAKVDPKKPELSNEAKQIRGVIAACSNIEQLKAYIAEYKAVAEARYGPITDLRSSVQEELPEETPAAENLSGPDADIAASSKRLFGGGAQ